MSKRDGVAISAGRTLPHKFVARGNMNLKTLLIIAVAAAFALGGHIFLSSTALAQSPPGTPSSVSVTRSDGTLRASWDAVSGATSYHITYSSDNGTSWSLGALNHTNSSITISNIDNSKTYIVGVRARNEHGESWWRNSAPSGPFTPSTPTTPSSVDVTRTDGALLARWGVVWGATSYHITYTSNNGASWSLAALNHPDSSITISNIDNSKTYIVGVRARNSAGDSTWRNSAPAGPFQPPAPTPTPTPAPPQPPDAPASLTARAGDGSVILSWDDPADDSITRYEYNVNHNDTLTGKFSGWSSWQSIADSDADTVSHTVTGLTNGKEYRYHLRAVNAQGAGSVAPSADPWYVTATPDESAPGIREPDKDFDTLTAAGNAWPTGIWSDGATMWVADGIDDKIYAYKMSDKARDSDKDFDTLIAAGNTHPSGVWSDGTTMWVADSLDDKIYAYKMSDKTRDSDKDFNPSGDGIRVEGIWSDGTTMWVVDRPDYKIYAYKMSDKQRDSSKDIDLMQDKYALGLWSDGATIWVSDHVQDELYAYDMSDNQRDSSKNYLLDSANANAYGMWSNGTTMWVADLTDGKVYAYHAYPTQQ